MRQVPSFAHMPLHFNVRGEFGGVGGGRRYEIRKA